MPIALLPWIGSAVGGWAIFDWLGGDSDDEVAENPLQTINLTKIALGGLGLFLAYKLIKGIIN